MNAREICLRAAATLADREPTHGNKVDTHRRIAQLWNAYLAPVLKKDEGLTATDVALMMIMLKIARAEAGFDPDHFVDMAGYSGCAGEIAEGERSG